MGVLITEGMVMVGGVGVGRDGGWGGGGGIYKTETQVSGDAYPCIETSDPFRGTV